MCSKGPPAGRPSDNRDEAGYFFPFSWKCRRWQRRWPGTPPRPCRARPWHVISQALHVAQGVHHLVQKNFIFLLCTHPRTAGAGFVGSVWRKVNDVAAAAAFGISPLRGGRIIRVGVVVIVVTTGVPFVMVRTIPTQTRRRRVGIIRYAARADRWDGRRARSLVWPFRLRHYRQFSGGVKNRPQDHKADRVARQVFQQTDDVIHVPILPPRVAIDPFRSDLSHFTSPFESETSQVMLPLGWPIKQYQRSARLPPRLPENIGASNAKSAILGHAWLDRCGARSVVVASATRCERKSRRS